MTRALSFAHRTWGHALQHLHEVAPAVVVELGHFNATLLFTVLGVLFFIFAVQAAISAEG